MHCNCLISIIKVLLNFILIPYLYHLTTNLINKIIIIIFFPGISQHKRDCNEKNQNKYTLPLDLLLPFLPLDPMVKLQNDKSSGMLQLLQHRRLREIHII